MLVRSFALVFTGCLLFGCGGGALGPSPSPVRTSRDIIAEDQLGRRAVTWGVVVVTHLESSTPTPLKTENGADGVDEWTINGNTRRSLTFYVRIPAVRFRVRDRDGNLLFELKQGDPPARVNVADKE